MAGRRVTGERHDSSAPSRARGRVPPRPPPAAPQAAGAEGVHRARVLDVRAILVPRRAFRTSSTPNPEAPKGGDVKLAAIGTFDTLNPFVLKGVPAAGIGGVFDTLTVQSDDEPFSQYGLVAETIEIPADRTWAAFTLRPQARFHDGSPITVEDVIWTSTRSRRRAARSSDTSQVTKAEKVGDPEDQLGFTRDNRELPLIVGQLPVLFPGPAGASRELQKTTLSRQLGSIISGSRA